VEQSMRERMEEHRGNPVCAACHMKMDPIGFMLENFDGVGAWRTAQFSKPLDVSGQLADGAKLKGPIELRTQLMKYQQQFMRGVTAKLMTYALGRGVEYFDMPTVRAIVKDSGGNNNRFSSLVIGIVKSAPFQMNVKTAEGEKIALK